MTRLPLWDAHLARFVTATAGTPFAWSTMDCAAWPLRAVDAMCGTTHGAALAGAYDSFEGSVAYCAAHGWATLADAVVELLGARRLPTVLHAQRGDLICLPPRDTMLPEEEHPPTLGILLLNVNGSGYVPTPDGLRHYTLRALARARGVAFAVAR